MASPPNVNTRAVSGKFVMNKSLSDNPDEILRLQGVSWFKRRVISLFTLTLCIKHTTNEAGIEYLDTDQILSGGIPGMSEHRALDGRERDESHFIFGFVTEKWRRISVEEITDGSSKEDWTRDTIDNGVILAESWSTPDRNGHTWRAAHAWGFAMVNGERRYVTQTTFTSPQKQDGPIHARFVYDYIGTI